MRLLSISYGFMLQPAYQWKATEFQRRCDALLVLIPQVGKELWSGRPVRRQHGPLNDVPHQEVRLLLNVNKHFAVIPRGTLRSVLSDFRPDVIEVENEPFNLGSSQIVAAARRYALGSRVFLHAAQNLLKRYPPPFNSTERYVFERCAGVFARNEKAAMVLRRRGLRADKIHLMGHGVSLREFARIRDVQLSYGAARPTVVLYVGALTHQKGVDVLLRAIARSRQAERVVIAGDGPERESLERLAGDLGIRGRVDFLGHVEHDRLLRLYAEAGCFVLPSRTTRGLVEQFGRVLLEALAAGCPIVASDSGNIPNVVGDAGIIVPEGKAEVLAEALDRIFLIPDDALRRQIAGVERVRRQYEWSVVVDRMMNVFEGKDPDVETISSIGPVAEQLGS